MGKSLNTSSVTTLLEAGRIASTNEVETSIVEYVTSSAMGMSTRTARPTLTVTFSISLAAKSGLAAVTEYTPGRRAPIW